MLPGRGKGSEDVGKGQTMVIVSRGRETSGHQVHQVVSDVADQKVISKGMVSKTRSLLFELA